MSVAKYDAVVSYHTNPYTCGVAKWNQRLAAALGVPLVPFGTPATFPLVSVKPSEIPVKARQYLPRPYDLLLHGWPATVRPRHRVWQWVQRADHVWTVAPEIAPALLAIRRDIQVLSCPATIETPRPRASRTYLTFGMANKTRRVLRHYEAFRDHLGAEAYTILLSLSVHEGSPWDDTLEYSAQALRDIFGPERVEVLGFLSDAALHREIEAATACVAFYDPAIRANNTTAWAVLERGKLLFTNFDGVSPFEIQFGPLPTWDVVIGQLGHTVSDLTTPVVSPETSPESPACHTIPSDVLVIDLPNHRPLGRRGAVAV